MNALAGLISKIGAYTLRKEGQEYIFKCCKCGRKKLEVNLKKKLFHCFHCKFGGALEVLYRELRLEYLVEQPWPHEVKEPKASMEVLTAEKSLNTQVSSSKSLTDEHLAYLTTRGIFPSDARRLGILSGTGKYGRRILIPLVESNIIYGYEARAVTDFTKPKCLYLGTNKSWLIYGIDNVKRGKNVVITEGIFDAESANRGGYTAISLMGSTISEIQIGKILARDPTEILIALDNDSAGWKGSMEVYMAFYARRARSVIVRWGRSGPAVLKHHLFKDFNAMPHYVIKEILDWHTVVKEAW